MTIKKFSGQTAIVTGAGQGIGFEIARQLALGGAAVLVNDVDANLANKAAEMVNTAGGNCITLAGDASDVDFIQHMVDTAVQHFGKLTIAR